jgi:hypothetical protein
MLRFKNWNPMTNNDIKVLLSYFITIVWPSNWPPKNEHKHWYYCKLAYWHVLLKMWCLSRNFKCQKNISNHKNKSLSKNGHIANLILHIGNTYIAIANPIISMASKSPTITWQGAHYDFMKLITRANVSCPNLDIHKSKDVITQESKARITYYSMVLATNEGMTCGTICIWFGNTTWGFWHMTKCLNH